MTTSHTPQGREGEWTPGPWIAGAGLRGGPDDSPWPFGWIMAEGAPKGPMHVAEVRGWGYLTGGGHGALGLDNDSAVAIQVANAHLIAAAPDLAQALQGMVDAYWRGSEDSDDEHAPSMVKAAQAALSKARGEK